MSPTSKKVDGSTSRSRMHKRAAYTEEDVIKAIDDIKSGKHTQLSASKLYCIPRSTLQDKLHERRPIYKKMGPNTYLTAAEENVLVSYIISAQKRALPVNKETVLSLVSSLILDERSRWDINRERSFKFGREGTTVPGEKWFQLFLRRHPNIVTRTSEALSASRMNISEQCIRQWFSEVRSYLAENELLQITKEPGRIFNLDESAFHFSMNAGKVLAEKGSRYVHYGTSKNEKERVTVVANIGADGSLPPPLIIYKNTRIPMSVYEAFPQHLASIGKSESCFINNELLYEYLLNSFNNWLNVRNVQRPVIIFSDKHESRLNYHLVKELSEAKIILIVLPPNTTHLMQPLDVGIFGPLKSAWETCACNYKNTRNTFVTKETFAQVFMQMYIPFMTKEKISNAFQRCGLYPFDPDAPDYGKLTKEAAHSSEARIFEGVVYDGKVDRSSQVSPFKKLNARTQTVGSTQYSNSIIESMGAGQAMKLCSKSFDDSVIDCLHLDGLRYVMREKWFNFENDRQRRQEPCDVEPESHLNLTPTQSLTPSSSISITPKVRKCSISPAMLQHRWFPSPRKTVPRIRTVQQEMHAASVLTGEEVVGLLKTLRDKKKTLESAKELRLKKKLQLAEQKKVAATKPIKAKRKLPLVSKKSASDKPLKKKKVVEYSSDSNCSVSGASSEVDTDIERFEDEINNNNATPSCSDPSSIEKQSFYLREPRVGDYVACRFQQGTRGRGSKKENVCVVYMGKVDSIILSNEAQNEETVYYVHFFKEKCDQETGTLIYYWNDAVDDYSEMFRDELVVVDAPSRKKTLGYRGSGNFIFDESILREVNLYLLKPNN